MENNNKYQNSKVYKITDIGYNKCYYGSTVQPLSVRMAEHRKAYNKFKNGKGGNFTIFNIFDEYGVENTKIELVETFSCNNKEELLKREGYYIKNNECVNKCIAGRTDAEYREDNKDKLREFSKEYRMHNRETLRAKKVEYLDNNKEKIKEQQKEYRLQNKDKIKQLDKEYRERNKHTLKERKKEWVEANKDRLKEKWREYRHANQDKIKESKSVNMECKICNCIIRRVYKAGHERSQKHQQALSKIEEASP